MEVIKTEKKEEKREKGKNKTEQNAEKDLEKALGTHEKEQYRVVISKEANTAVERAVSMVNADFDGGLVTRSDLANYVFLNLHRLLVEADVKSLRAQFFDAKKVLSSLLRSSDELPEDIQRALRIAYGITDKEKRRTPKANTELSTVTDVDNSSVA